MFRGNKIEPTILEEGTEDGVSVKETSAVLPFDSKNDDVDEMNHSKSSIVAPATLTNAASSTSSFNTISPRASAVNSAKRPSIDGSGRRSSSVAYYMDRMQSTLRKTIGISARRQLFQTQKFFTPFKRWLYGFYDRKFEPPLDLALGDLKENRSGAWVCHPKTMCCVHIIQTQLVTYRKASNYRVMETYILTGLPIWGTFVFQGSLIYYLWSYLRGKDIPTSAFCSNSFLLEYSALVVFCMFTLVENTERFETSALVALSPLYGRLPNMKKFDVEVGEEKPGMHSMIMHRHLREYLNSSAPRVHKLCCLLSMCSVLFDVYIFVVITYVGCKYIALSNGVSDVIQSAVALSFIWSLSDVIFHLVYSESIVEDLESIHILMPTNETDWEIVEEIRNKNNQQPPKPFPSAFTLGLQSSPNLGHFGIVHPTLAQHQTSTVSAAGTSTTTSSVSGEDQNLEEHVLFQNNNVVYNAFFVICMMLVPMGVAAVLVPTRIHYCGTAFIEGWG